jgi:DNA-directed RNA polymerase specialized sigma24 family protein
MLTPDSRQACNLARAACVRLIKQRRSLRREGDFRAVLIQHALAIWRSQHSLPTGEQSVAESGWADSDFASFEGVDNSRLAEETDFALRQLTAFELDVVLSICVDDESTDDVARRYNLPEEKIRAALDKATPVLATSFAAWSCACPSESAMI